MAGRSQVEWKAKTALASLRSTARKDTCTSSRRDSNRRCHGAQAEAGGREEQKQFKQVLHNEKAGLQEERLRSSTVARLHTSLRRRPVFDCLHVRIGQTLPGAGTAASLGPSRAQCSAALLPTEYFLNPQPTCSYPYSTWSYVLLVADLSQRRAQRLILKWVASL